MRLFKYFLIVLAIIAIFSPAISRAQDTSDSQTATDQVTIVKAKVVEVVSQTTEVLPGTNAESPVQTLEAEITREDVGKLRTILSCCKKEIRFI